MTEVSQEAVEQLAKERLGNTDGGWDRLPSQMKSANRGSTKATLEECFPAIQAQVLAGVKERLLSDEVVDAFADGSLSTSARLKVPKTQLRREIRDGMRSALAALNPNGGES